MGDLFAACQECGYIVEACDAVGGIGNVANKEEDRKREQDYR